MAENSLFAILLRSSWWLSAVIGLVVVMLAVAIARGQFLILGVSLSLPFFGIAIYSGVKQLQRPSAKQVAAVATQARSLSAAQVAQKIAANYERERFESSLFKGKIAELEVTRGYRKLLISCRRIKAANTGIEPLKELVAAGEAIEATGYLFVTLGVVSANAVEYAQQNDIQLVGASELADYFSNKAKVG